MRIADMQRREPFDAILDRTLAAAWTELLGEPVTVQRPPTPGQQVWRVLPLFSTLVTGTPGRAARRFLKDQLRFTPIRGRALPQWALAEVLSSAPVLGRVGAPALSLSRAVPGAAERLVLPGNQRVRLFDFAAGQVRVRVKDGFARRTMETEIALRAGAPTLERPPWVPITAHDPGAAWFDEPIVAAWELGRLPPWVNARAAEDEALRQLDRWLDHTAVEEPAPVVAAGALAAARDALAATRARFPQAAPGAEAWLAALADAAADAATVVTAHTHGDLQPGNVLVGRTEPRVWLIDWEHAARRGRLYDRLVYGLRSRRAAGLAARVRAVLGGRAPLPERGALSALPTAPAARRAAVALFLLEDLTFYLRESTTGPYTQPSAGLGHYVAELSRCGADLIGLLG